MAGRHCVLGTHIGAGWDGPDRFQEAVRGYLEEVGYDQFVYVRDPVFYSEVYDDLADDDPIHSDSGFLGADEVDTLLDRFTRFDHLGAYWEGCHGRTWESLMAGIYGEGRDATYHIVFPAQCIAGKTELLQEKAEDWEDTGAVEQTVADYIDTAEEYAGEDLVAGRHFAATVVDETPVVAWTVGGDAEPPATAIIDEVTAGEASAAAVRAPGTGGFLSTVRSVSPLR